MPPDTDSKNTSLSRTVSAIGNHLKALDPGPLAQLRRMSFTEQDHGAPDFWLLVARCNIRQQDEETWASIVQIMATLTDKGRDDNKPSPHAAGGKNNWRGLGHALCDGGDPNWGAGELDPRPMLSELRFARLLAAKGDTRAALMTRAARALAAQKPPGKGVNCADLARFLLFPTSPDPVRKLARDYYARLDRTTRNNHTENTDTATGDTQ